MYLRSPTSTTCDTGQRPSRGNQEDQGAPRETRPGSPAYPHELHSSSQHQPQFSTSLTLLEGRPPEDHQQPGVHHSEDHNPGAHHREDLNGSLVQSPTELHIYRSQSPTLPSANPALVNSYPNRSVHNYSPPGSSHPQAQEDQEHRLEELTNLHCRDTGSYSTNNNQRRYTNLSPPVFRIPEVCSSTTPPPAPPIADTPFAPLHTSSPNNHRSVEEGSASATFRLTDFTEPGYKLDLQSGQLQIHLDLSSAGDVLNLSSLPPQDHHEPSGTSSTLKDSISRCNNNNVDVNNQNTVVPNDHDSGYINSNYYDMSTSNLTNMEDSETTQSVYPYPFTANTGSATTGGGTAGAAGNPSSSPYLTRGYDLYSPSLYSQYYQNYPWPQPQGKICYIFFGLVKGFQMESNTKDTIQN